MPEKQSIMLANGEKYAYIEQSSFEASSSIEASSEDGAETFLLLHGNMSSSVHFLPLFKRLTDFHLIAPDLRGFGDSSYNAEFSNLGELAEDVKLFADALGISQVHIVGWSAGGGVALELAARYPNLVSSLFIIEGLSYKGYSLGTEPFASKEKMAESPFMRIPLDAFKTKDAAYFNFVWNVSIYTVNKPGEDENKLYINETLKQRNLIDLNWALVTFNMSGEHNGYSAGSGTIGAVVCPVAFTCGDKDVMVPQSIIRDNASAIEGSTLLVYEKCGHSPLVDCPDRLAADIRAHVNTVWLQSKKLPD